MIRLNKNIYLRIVSDAALVLEEDLKLVHPIVKQLFYKKVFQKVLGKGFHQAGKLKKFSPKLGAYNRGPRYISLNKRLQNTRFESNYSRLCANNSKNEQGTLVENSGSRDRGNAEERNNMSDT